MYVKTHKTALGGGCHWCTEAVYQSLKGVEKVEQGYVSSTGENSTFSEAVVVHFNPEKVSLHTLIEIHLYTHKSTSDHSMRDKYRSAIYVFTKEQKIEAQLIIDGFQKAFDYNLVTRILPFERFKFSRKQIQNYYYSNPQKPFCETFINPKLKLLLDKFSSQINHEKLPCATNIKKEY